MKPSSSDAPGHNQPRKIGDLARIVTSKNAGPYRLTIDVFFVDEESYRLVRDSGTLTPTRIARAYRTGEEHVRVIRFSDAAMGAKITIDQPVSADDFRSRDTYGAQQHIPVADLEVVA